MRRATHHEQQPQPPRRRRRLLDGPRQSPRRSRRSTTTDDLIAALTRHFDPIDADSVAYFPDFDDDLFDTLTAAGHLTTVWVRTPWHFAMRDADGNGFTFCECHFKRGVERPF